jgi:peroxiredoxin
MNIRRVAVFLGLLSICLAQHTPRKCADVAILTTSGKTVRISQYRGKVVMVVMFVASDPPCLQTLQMLSRWQNELGPRGLQIVGVSLDQNADVAPFAERYRFPFPLGHLQPDQAIQLADLNKTARPVVPYIMFIDWQGNVRIQYPGNHPIFNLGEMGIRTIADGLLRQAAEKKGAEYKSEPAKK